MSAPVADDEIDGTIDLDPKDTQDEPEEGSTEEPADDLDDDGQPDKEPDDEEIEWDDGKKYRIPKAVKDGVLRQRDYTRKTMELSEARKAFDAEREKLTEWRTAEGEAQAMMGELAFIERQIADADKIDWNAWLNHQLPAQRNAAQAAMNKLRLLERQRDTLKGKIQEGKQKWESEAAAATRERLKATAAFAQKELPGWTPERDNAISEMVRGLGIPDEEVVKVISPEVYRLLDLALDGHRYREQRAKAKSAKKATEQAQVVPLERVKARGSSDSRPNERLSTDEWMARRTKEVRAKGRR